MCQNEDSFVPFPFLFFFFLFSSSFPSFFLSKGNDRDSFPSIVPSNLLDTELSALSRRHSRFLSHDRIVPTVYCMPTFCIRQGIHRRYIIRVTSIIIRCTLVYDIFTLSSRAKSYPPHSISPEESRKNGREIGMEEGPSRRACPLYLRGGGHANRFIESFEADIQIGLPAVSST